MFEGIKNNLQRTKYKKLFLFIVGATATAPNYGMVPEKDADILAKAEPTLVNVNKTITSVGEKDVKLVAASATPAGVAAAAALAAEPEKPKAAAIDPSSIKIETGIPVPEIKRGGARKEDVYPFKQLEVGQSFFVAATPERENPAKALASTVSGATKRYREDTGETESFTNKKGETGTRKKMKDTRVFTVRAVEGGARVWRTA